MARSRLGKGANDTSPVYRIGGRTPAGTLTGIERHGARGYTPNNAARPTTTPTGGDDAANRDESRPEGSWPAHELGGVRQGRSAGGLPVRTRRRGNCRE